MTAGRLTLTRMSCLKIIAKTGVLPADEEQSAYDTGEEIFEEVESLLHASPIVSGKPLLSEYEGFGRTIGTNELCFKLPLVFRVHWPIKNQEMFGDPEQTIEDFEIWYDGAIVSVVAEVARPLEGWQSFAVGREGVRILREVLGGSKLFDLSMVGPYTMFTAVYISVSDEVAGAYHLGRALLKEHLRWESLLKVKDEGELRDTIQALRGPARMFYILMDARIAMEEHISTLESHFEAASEKYGNSVSAWTWSPREWWRRRDARLSLRAEISSAYAAYASAEAARLRMSDLLRDTEEMFGGNPGLESLVDYPRHSIRSAADWSAQHLLEGLRFLAEESRSRRLESATVYAPLAGAVIGAAATAAGLLVAK